MLERYERETNLSYFWILLDQLDEFLHPRLDNIVKCYEVMLKKLFKNHQFAAKNFLFSILLTKNLKIRHFKA